MYTFSISYNFCIHSIKFTQTIKMFWIRREVFYINKMKY